MVNCFFTVSIAMNFDPYTGKPIHRNGIWDSGCLTHEDHTQNQIYNCLQKLDYIQSPSNHKLWTRENQTVIVCLVDDIRSCSTDYHVDTPFIFDNNTTIITDSYIGCPTQYNVIQLPKTFFGIYAAATPMPQWQPDRLFTLSINRIDTLRTQLLLEIASKVYIDKGYVNFNCQDRFHGDIFRGQDHLPQAFEQHYQILSNEQKNQWQAAYSKLSPRMPLKNYDIDHTEIYHRSWLNVDCETYASDNSAAFSEKTFRLLQTPVPWLIYAGRYAVAYLQRLGFDCLTDLQDHNAYDRLKAVENRVGIFMWHALNLSRSNASKGIDSLQQRCQQAAEHNRKLLQDMQRAWPGDFQQWQQTLLTQLA